MAVEEIIDIAVDETAHGSEVTARLLRLADWEGIVEWRREWRMGGEWCSCPIPEDTAHAIRSRVTAPGAPLAA